jgi:hypothetical protein
LPLRNMSLSSLRMRRVSQFFLRCDRMVWALQFVPAGGPRILVKQLTLNLLRLRRFLRSPSLVPPPRPFAQTPIRRSTTPEARLINFHHNPSFSRISITQPPSQSYPERFFNSSHTLCLLEPASSWAYREFGIRAYLAPRVLSLMLIYDPSRLFVTPVELDEAAKITDKTAARSRSAIRRQRTIRRSNHQLRPEESGVRTPYEGSSTPILPDHVPDFTDVVSPTEEAEIEAIRARVARRRLRETVRSLPPGSLLARGEYRVPRASRDRPPSPPRQRADGPPTPQATSSSNFPPMPPVPESRDFQGSHRPIAYARRGGNRSWTDYRRSSQNYQLESHSTLSRRETSTDLANGSGTQLPALTPNFSPARRYMLEESRDRPGSNSPPSILHYLSYSAVSIPFLSLQANIEFHTTAVFSALAFPLLIIY